MRILGTLAAATAAMAVATPAVAVTTIDFTNITATWTDVVGGANVTYTGANTSDASIHWGTGGPQSGYRFEAIGIPSLVIDPDTDTSAVVNIGKFTHYNFPIDAGSSITAVKLNFTTDVLVNGNPFGNVNFVYAFDHFETPNGDNPCADGGALGAGVNLYGCADRVAVNFNQDSGAFTIDDVEYALDVRGFLVGALPAELFWTKETKTNEAFLRGQVVLRSLAGDVPEPSTWGMMILGFGVIGAALRRQQRANVNFAF